MPATTHWPSLSAILDLPIEEQATYADSVCARGARILPFCQGQLAGLADNPQYHLWNTTAVGNLAFMSLHGCEETRDAYKRILDEATVYFRQRRRVAQSCLLM